MIQLFLHVPRMCDGCLAFTNSDHSLAPKSDVEVYRHIEFDIVRDVRRDLL